MSEAKVTYTPRPDATPEGELAALPAVYAFVLQARERNKAASIEEDDKEVDSTRRPGHGQ